MQLILLIIYSIVVWFIFFKKKWLPWNITSQVIVVTIPVFCLAVIILFMNIVAPSAGEVRAQNYVIPIVPRVTGQVIEVPIALEASVARHRGLWAAAGRAAREGL
jgi:multidrug resistance efflux pump